MKQFQFLLFIIIFNPAVYAGELQFEKSVTVTTAREGVFLHLDASGRRTLAVSNKTAAVVWEDNRSGRPAAYVAYRNFDESGFSEPQKISDREAAYEPVIVAHTKNIFIVGWEEGGHTWLRVVSPSRKGEAVRIGQKKSQQISLAVDRSADNEISARAVWSQGIKRDYHIYYADLSIKDYDIKIVRSHPVDISDDKDVQLYPVIEFSENGSVVVWEDRRQGATRIFSAYAPNERTFGRYRLLNEYAPSPNPEFGKGSGAMRPALSGNGKRVIVAVWMDKRNWRSGYDVFAAVSTNGGQSFAKNEQAQDMFGDNVPQWHASIACCIDNDLAVVSWDDTRNETPDVFYSMRKGNVWSEDYELPGASGDGRQTHPSVLFDQHGKLHAVWLDNRNGLSSLKYISSRQ